MTGDTTLRHEDPRSQEARCNARCEVWSRIVGYYRPLSDWNRGKRHEFSLRKMVKVSGETVERIPATPSTGDGD